MTLKEQIMKLQTYKMHKGEDTVYVERDDVLKALEQEPCEDAISRDDALMCMTGEYLADKECKPEDIISKHIRRLRALPSVQLKPKTGHWINKKPRWIPSLSMTIHDAYECSNCGESGVHYWDYCPYCGAKMESEG